MEHANLLESAKQFEENGFIVIKDFFEKEEVLKAYEEIESAYSADLQERAKQDSPKEWHESHLGKSILTSPTHILLDVYGKSPALDRMFEKILTDSFSSALLKKLTGGNIKLRGYNCQKLTGALDEAPKLGPAPNPHEWHRDSPSEICISIFLTDIGPNQGATALVPESHTFPFCPRWNCLFGPPYRLPGGRIAPNESFFLKNTIFNKILGKRVKAKAVGAYGKRGDFYIFINDMWHGREPNTSGQPGIKFMAGAFPLNAPFPDSVPVPSEELLQKLPPSLKLAAAQEGNRGADQNTILNRIQEKQKGRKKLLFRLARMERQLADKIAQIIA